MLTAYDALTAGIFDRAGIPVLLVGDSAAMVVFGHDTTIPVTVDDLIPLTAAVVRGTSRALVVADLPFGSYQASPGAALHAATRFLKETGAHAVKLEGGQRVAQPGRGARRGGHPGDGPPRADPAVGQRLRRLPGAGTRRRRRAAAARRQGAAGGRRVRRGARVRARCPGRPGHRGADHPHHRHRRRPGLRRPGAGLAGHGRPVPAVAKFVKQYADVAGVLHDAARAFADDVTNGTFPTRSTPTGRERL